MKMNIPRYELQFPVFVPSSGLSVTPSISGQSKPSKRKESPPKLEIYSIPSSQVKDPKLLAAPKVLKDLPVPLKESLAQKLVTQSVIKKPEQSNLGKKTLQKIASSGEKIKTLKLYGDNPGPSMKKSKTREEFETRLHSILDKALPKDQDEPKQQPVPQQSEKMKLVIQKLLAQNNKDDDDDEKEKKNYDSDESTSSSVLSASSSDSFDEDGAIFKPAAVKNRITQKLSTLIQNPGMDVSKKRKANKKSKTNFKPSGKSKKHIKTSKASNKNRKGSGNPKFLIDLTEDILQTPKAVDTSKKVSENPRSKVKLKTLKAVNSSKNGSEISRLYIDLTEDCLETPNAEDMGKKGSESPKFCNDATKDILEIPNAEDTSKIESENPKYIGTSRDSVETPKAVDIVKKGSENPKVDDGNKDSSEIGKFRDNWPYKLPKYESIDGEIDICYNEIPGLSDSDDENPFEFPADDNSQHEEFARRLEANLLESTVIDKLCDIVSAAKTSAKLRSDKYQDESSSEEIDVVNIEPVKISDVVLCGDDTVKSEPSSPVKTCIDELDTKELIFDRTQIETINNMRSEDYDFLKRQFPTVVFTKKSPDGADMDMRVVLEKISFPTTVQMSDLPLHLQALNPPSLEQSSKECTSISHNEATLSQNDCSPSDSTPRLAHVPFAPEMLPSSQSGIDQTDICAPQSITQILHTTYEVKTSGVINKSGHSKSESRQSIPNVLESQVQGNHSKTDQLSSENKDKSGKSFTDKNEVVTMQSEINFSKSVSPEIRTVELTYENEVVIMQSTINVSKSVTPEIRTEELTSENNEKTEENEVVITQSNINSFKSVTPEIRTEEVSSENKEKSGKRVSDKKEVVNMQSEINSFESVAPEIETKELSIENITEKTEESFSDKNDSGVTIQSEISSFTSVMPEIRTEELSSEKKEKAEELFSDKNKDVALTSEIKSSKSVLPEISTEELSSENKEKTQELFSDKNESGVTLQSEIKSSKSVVSKINETETHITEKDAKIQGSSSDKKISKNLVHIKSRSSPKLQVSEGKSVNSEKEENSLQIASDQIETAVRPSLWAEITLSKTQVPETKLRKISADKKDKMQESYKNEISSRPNLRSDKTEIPEKMMVKRLADKKEKLANSSNDKNEISSRPSLRSEIISSKTLAQETKTKTLPADKKENKQDSDINEFSPRPSLRSEMNSSKTQVPEVKTGNLPTDKREKLLGASSDTNEIPIRPSLQSDVNLSKTLVPEAKTGTGKNEKTEESDVNKIVTRASSQTETNASQNDVPENLRAMNKAKKLNSSFEPDSSTTLNLRSKSAKEKSLPEETKNSNDGKKSFSPQSIKHKLRRSSSCDTDASNESGPISEPENRIETLRSSVRRVLALNAPAEKKTDLKTPETKEAPETSETPVKDKALDVSSPLMQSLAKLFKSSKAAMPPPPPTPFPVPLECPSLEPEPAVSEPEPESTVSEPEPAVSEPELPSYGCPPVYIEKKFTNLGINLRKAYMENIIDPDKIPASALVSRRGRVLKLNRNSARFIKKRTDNVCSLFSSSEIEIKKTKVCDGSVASTESIASNDTSDLVLNTCVTIVPLRRTKLMANINSATTENQQQTDINHENRDGSKLKFPSAENNKRFASEENIVSEKRQKLGSVTGPKKIGRKRKVSSGENVPEKVSKLNPNEVEAMSTPYSSDIKITSVKSLTDQVSPKLNCYELSTTPKTSKNFISQIMPGFEDNPKVQSMYALLMSKVLAYRREMFISHSSSITSVKSINDLVEKTEATSKKLCKTNISNKRPSLVESNHVIPTTTSEEKTQANSGKLCESNISNKRAAVMISNHDSEPVQETQASSEKLCKANVSEEPTSVQSNLHSKHNKAIISKQDTQDISIRRSERKVSGKFSKYAESRSKSTKDDEETESELEGCSTGRPPSIVSNYSENEYLEDINEASDSEKESISERKITVNKVSSSASKLPEKNVKPSVDDKKSKRKTSVSSAGSHSKRKNTSSSTSKQPVTNIEPLGAVKARFGESVTESVKPVTNIEPLGAVKATASEQKTQSNSGPSALPPSSPLAKELRREQYMQVHSSIKMLPSKKLFTTPDKFQKSTRSAHSAQHEACTLLTLSLLLRGRQNKKKYTVLNTARHVEFHDEVDNNTKTNVCMMPVVTSKNKSLSLSQHLAYSLQVFRKFDENHLTIFVLYSNTEINMDDRVLSILVKEIVFNKVNLNMPEVSVNPVLQIADDKVTKKIVEHFNISESTALRFLKSFFIASNQADLNGLKGIVDGGVSLFFNSSTRESEVLRKQLSNYLFHSWSCTETISNEQLDPIVYFIKSRALSPKNTSIDYGLSLGFFGRDVELDLLTTNTGGPQNRPIGVAVTGPPGVGKTHLVLKYAQTRSSHFEHVLWFNAESSSTLQQDLCTLAFKLHLIEKVGVYDINVVVECMYILLEQFHCLFVFDNVRDISYLRQYLPKEVSENHSFVVTSHQVEWPSEVRIELGETSKEESVVFLKSGKDAEEVVKTLECFPFALQSALSYIDHKLTILKLPKFDLTDLLAEIKRDSKEFLQFRQENGKSLATNWDHVLEILSSYPDGKLCLKVLDILAYLHADHITIGFLKRLIPENLENCIHVMQSLSILRVENDQFIKISQILQQVLKLKCTSKLQTLYPIVSLLNSDLENRILSVNIPHILEVCSCAIKVSEMLRRKCRSLIQAVLKADLSPDQFEFFFTKFQHFVKNHFDNDEFVKLNTRWVHFLYAQKKFDQVIDVCIKIFCPESQLALVSDDVFQISLLTANILLESDRDHIAWELLNSMYIKNKSSTVSTYNEWEIVSKMCQVACHLQTLESLSTCRILLVAKSICEKTSFERTSMFTRRYAQLLAKNRNREEISTLCNEISKRLEYNKSQNEHKILLCKLDFAAILNKMDLVDDAWNMLQTFFQTLCSKIDPISRQNLLHLMFEVSCKKFLQTGQPDGLLKIKLYLHKANDFELVLAKLIEELQKKPMTLLKLYKQVSCSASPYVSLCTILTLKNSNQLNEAFKACHELVLVATDHELFVTSMRLCCDIACELDVIYFLTDPFNICCSLVEKEICNLKHEPSLIISFYHTLSGHLKFFKKTKRANKFYNCIEQVIKSNFDDTKQKQLLSLLC